MADLLLLVVVASGLFQTPSVAPLLTVTAIVPPEPGDSSSTCRVTIANAHNKRAIAWIIQRMPGAQEGYTTDFAITPGTGLLPGASHIGRISCAEGIPEPVEITAVLYEDDSVGGDPELLKQHVIPTRRSQALGLRELAQLLAVARFEQRPGLSAVARVGALIEQSVGPQITSMVKAKSLGLLQEVSQSLGLAGAGVDPQILGSRLIAEMSSLANALESSSLAKEVQ